MRLKLLSLLALTSFSLASAPALADTFSGEITKIDRHSKSIEVRDGDSQRKLRFFLSGSGEVTRDGAPVRFATLRRGERVEVDFARNNGSHFARSIAVVAAEDAVAATK